MRWLIACTLALIACRTPPLPVTDGAVAPVADLASPSAPGDLGLATLDMCFAACPTTTSCPAGAWCIYVDRGDCSRWSCMLPQGNCGGATPTCACAGGDAFCQLFANNGETLKCVDQTPFGFCAQPGFGNMTCQSSILCI